MKIGGYGVILDFNRNDFIKEITVFKINEDQEEV